MGNGLADHPDPLPDTSASSRWTLATAAGRAGHGTCNSGHFAAEELRTASAASRAQRRSDHARHAAHVDPAPVHGSRCREPSEATAVKAGGIEAGQVDPSSAAREQMPRSPSAATASQVRDSCQVAATLVAARSLNPSLKAPRHRQGFVASRAAAGSARSLKPSPDSQPSAERLAEERDSNPRYPFGYSGFQDRRHQPLGHPSARYSARLTEPATCGRAAVPGIRPLGLLPKRVRTRPATRFAQDSDARNPGCQPAVSRPRFRARAQRPAGARRRSRARGVRPRPTPAGVRRSSQRRGHQAALLHERHDFRVGDRGRPMHDGKVVPQRAAAGRVAISNSAGPAKSCPLTSPRLRRSSSACAYGPRPVRKRIQTDVSTSTIRLPIVSTSAVRRPPAGAARPTCVAPCREAHAGARRLLPRERLQPTPHRLGVGAGARGHSRLPEERLVDMQRLLHAIRSAISVWPSEAPCLEHGGTR